MWVYDRRPDICVRAGELQDEEDEQVRRSTRSTGGGGGGGGGEKHCSYGKNKVG